MHHISALQPIALFGEIIIPYYDIVVNTKSGIHIPKYINSAKRIYSIKINSV